MFLIYVAIRITLDPSLAPAIEEGAHRLEVAVHSFPEDAAERFHLLPRDGSRDARRRHADRSCAATGVAGSGRSCSLLRQAVVAHDPRIPHIRRESIFAPAHRDALRCHVQPASDLHGCTPGARRDRHRPAAARAADADDHVGLPFLLFMFLDQIAIMLVLVPIYKPILTIYSFDEIWFFTLFLIVATVGGISPPFGYTLFASYRFVAEMPMSEVFRCILAVRLAHHAGPCRDGDLPAAHHLASQPLPPDLSLAEEMPMAKLTRTNPPGVHKPFSNHSHVVTAEEAKRLVFCAGQVAADPDGNAATRRLRRTGPHGDGEFG